MIIQGCYIVMPLSNNRQHDDYIRMLYFNATIGSTMIIQGCYILMQLPSEVYRWLVSMEVIPNEGEVDDKGLVTVGDGLFENGYRVGEVVRHIIAESKLKSPAVLTTIRNDSAKNSKLTNWNFLWLAFESLQLALDPRLKELILQGEHALIAEVLKQLALKDPSYHLHLAKLITIKPKSPLPPRTAAFDIKKLNLTKDPDSTESSLEFLILLLSSSLAMSVEQILGLFTNQNKYLAHIIVKGIAEKFDGIVLFYSLVNKHREKLGSFIPTDGENCLYALKAGFISKDARVVELTLELFGSLTGIYDWFVSEDSKCAHTLLLGLRRHPALASLYWDTLLILIQGHQPEFFADHYSASFNDSLDLLSITALLLPFAKASFTATLLPASVHWLDLTLALFHESTQQQINNSKDKRKIVVEQHALENRIIAFEFFGALLLNLPEALAQQNATESAKIDPFSIFTAYWKELSIIEFTTLLNQFITLLTQLAFKQSQFASRLYRILVQIFADIYSDIQKKEHLILNLIPLIAEFPTIPIEHVVQIYTNKILSSNDFLLLCEVVELCTDENTLTEVGTVLRDNFFSDPIVHYANPTLLYELAKKISPTYTLKLLQDVLSCYTQFLNKQSTTKQANKQKQIFQSFITKILELTSYTDAAKEKLMNANNIIRSSNHRMGSKALQTILAYKFNVNKQQLMDFQKEKEQNQTTNSKVKESKAISMAILKTPEPLKRQFEQLIERKKKEEEAKRLAMEQRIKEEERKKIQVKIQLQKVNIQRGVYTQAIIRDFTDTPVSLLDSSVTPPQLIEHYEQIQSLFAKNRQYLRQLFFNYSNTGHSNKKFSNFEDNMLHKECINEVELMKLLKAIAIEQNINPNQKSKYPNISFAEMQSLIKEVNVKIMKKWEVHELTYDGFEQFILQYIIAYMQQEHPTIQLYFLTKTFFKQFKDKTKKNIQPPLPNNKELTKPPNIKKQSQEGSQGYEDADPTSGPKYISTSVPPQQPTLSEVTKLNQQLQQNPNMILPTGYKKFTQKHCEFKYELSKAFKKNSYFEVYSILSSILKESVLHISLLEPLSEITTIVKAKSIKLEVRRSSSTAIGEKNITGEKSILNQKLQLKIPFGSKLALRSPSESKPATKHQKSKSVIGMLKSLEAVDMTQENENDQPRLKQVDPTLPSQSNPLEKDLSPMVNKSKIIGRKKSSIADRTEAFVRKSQKQENERAKIKEKQREEELKRRELTEKYLEDKKQKLEEKKRKDQEQAQRKRQEFENQLIQKKLIKEKFQQFHKSQLQKMRKQTEEQKTKAKQNKDHQTEEQKKQQENIKKLRTQIQQRELKLMAQYKEYEDRLNRLFQQLHPVFQEAKPKLYAVFEFLLRSTHLSLTQRKSNSEIIYETWRYFINVFELSPLLLPAKETVSLFKLLTKGKQITKQQITGLNFNEFERALFRIAVKAQQTLNLIANNTPLNDFLSLSTIQQHPDLTKVTGETIKALIRYLAVPAARVEQEKRFKELIGERKSTFVKEIDHLKDKIAHIYNSTAENK